MGQSRSCAKMELSFSLWSQDQHCHITLILDKLPTVCLPACSLCQKQFRKKALTLNLHGAEAGRAQKKELLKRQPEFSNGFP